MLVALGFAFWLWEDVPQNVGLAFQEGFELLALHFWGPILKKVFKNLIASEGMWRWRGERCYRYNRIVELWNCGIRELWNGLGGKGLSKATRRDIFSQTRLLGAPSSLAWDGPRDAVKGSVPRGVALTTHRSSSSCSGVSGLWEDTGRQQDLVATKKNAPIEPHAAPHELEIRLSAWKKWLGIADVK